MANGNPKGRTQKAKNLDIPMWSVGGKILGYLSVSLGVLCPTKENQLTPLASLLNCWPIRQKRHSCRLCQPVLCIGLNMGSPCGLWVERYHDI